MDEIDIIASELDAEAHNGNLGKLILLKGTWGSGKTYRWKNKIEPAIKREHKIYVSLFGMQHVEELKEQLYLKGLDVKFSKLWYRAILSIIACIFLFALFFYGVNYIFIEKFSQLNDDLKFFYLIVLIIAMLVATILFLPVAKSIILYFLDTTLGLNYNTVCLSKLLPPEKTILCFDDFERIAKISQPDAFLGYCNTLARSNGYHILFIAHVMPNFQEKIQEISNNINDNAEKIALHDCAYSECLLEYQEKLFDRIFEHEQSMKEILNQKDMSSVLKECLFNLIDRIQNEQTLLNEYDNDAIRYIEKIRGNIRIMFKIIDNMNTIYNYAPAVILDRNKIHKSVVNYVCGLTLAVETGYSSNMENVQASGWIKVLSNKSSSKRNFACFIMNYVSDIYDSLYDLLYKGIKTEQFNNEILPQDKLTTFENNLLEFCDKYYLEYRLSEINAMYRKVQRVLKQSNILFSSYENMICTLGKYCWLLSCVEKNLQRNTENRKKLFNSINTIIDHQNIELIPFERISFRITADNKDFKISQQLIIVQIYKCLVQSFVERIDVKRIFENFLDYRGDSNKYIKDIIYLLLMNDDTIVNIQSLANNNYAIFIKVWHKLNEYHVSWYEYKRLCTALNYPENSYITLIDKFEKIMSQIADKKSAHSPETINYAQFKKDKPNKIQEFGNGMKVYEV